MEDNINFDEVEYSTNRKLENDEGEEKGHLKMYSYDNELFHFRMTCPYCGHEFEDKQELGSRPWWIECPECTRSTNVFRIKDAHERKVKDRSPDTPDDVDV